MEWAEAYTQDRIPSLDDIRMFTGSAYWEDLNAWLCETFAVSPKIAYSKCPAQPGWNVKYQKGGKSLCTLYPMRGFFIALVVVGKKEMTETELLLQVLSEYTRALYESARFACGGKWLMLHVDREEVLNDVKKLVGIRVHCK